MTAEELRLLLEKTEQLCARCERLQREAAALKKENRQLAANNQNAKQMLNQILDRLPDYYQ